MSNFLLTLKGLVLNSHGVCVSKSECECSYVENSQLKRINTGESTMKDCNKCVCKNGKLECTNEICTEDGHWSEWSDWSNCKAEPCLLGFQWRTRMCLGTKNGGKVSQCFINS